jgi:hypothetical protein
VIVTPENHEGLYIFIYVVPGRTGTMKLPLLADV